LTELQRFKGQNSVLAPIDEKLKIISLKKVCRRVFGHHKLPRGDMRGSKFFTDDVEELSL
jgi:hypothetical protein